MSGARGRKTSSRGESFIHNKLFRGIPTKVLGQLDRIPEVVVAEAGDVIFDEGDPADCFYLIADGCVRISKCGRGSKQETLSYLEADDFFGEMAVYDPAPRSAQATATQETRLGRVDRTDLDELLQLAPSEISSNLTREIIQRLRQLDSHFINELLEAERLSLVGSMAGTIIHDFKNPMSVILGAASMLEEKTDDPGSVRLAGMIQRSVHRMLRMTQELLDYSRGISSLSLEKVAVDDLLEELDEQALDRLPELGIEVERNVELHATVLIDRPRFVRLLLNLVRNAVEAMPKGGLLTLSVEARDDHIVFTVGDTGSGIPEEILPTIFEPFVTHGKGAGTGLGLAIARSVVEAHEGTITVSSTPGVGTRFEIRIPAAKTLSSR